MSIQLLFWKTVQISKLKKHFLNTFFELSGIAPFLKAIQISFTKFWNIFYFLVTE